MATKMKMVSKGGKMVPSFAADGKGKMKMGGTKMKKMEAGGMHMMPDGSMMENSMMKKGGAKYQNGGPVEAMNKAMGKKEPSLKKTLKYVKKNGSGYIPSNNSATQRPNTDSYKSAGTSIKTAKKPNTKYQDGGMVNSNAKITADKTPGSKGVKFGVNPKVAKPKMAMGGTRPGMAKAGSKKYQTGGPTAEQQIESGARKNYMNNAKAKLMGVAAMARKNSGRKGKI